MLLFAIAYLGGVLTILSPCILPVLPFVFARGDQPFLKSGLPLLLGMALTFAGVASLAAVGGGWAVQANVYGRQVAMLLMALFGVALLFPHLAERLTRPLVNWGERLSASAGTPGAPGTPGTPGTPGASGGMGRRRSPFGTSLLLGVATGLLWAPCAGPILGLVLTGAALGGASAQTSLLLLAYAAGAASSLAAALLIGGRLFKAMKKSLGAGEWIRRGIGVALLCGVAAIALGLDTGVLAQLSLGGTSSVEQALIDKVKPPRAPGAFAEATTATTATTATAATQAPAADAAADEGPAPPLAGAVEWLNSPPLDMQALRGKVVLVDFWTYSCINCLRALPYVRAWADKYKDQGLVVIGVHAPEFAFEKNVDNVRKATRDLGVNYPVAIDNDYAIWRAFDNRYWPAHYFIDAKGRIRHHHYGEGEYDKSEELIRKLLAEAGRQVSPGDLVKVDAGGALAAASATVKSPETYVGWERAQNFASPGGLVRDRRSGYAAPDVLGTNRWAFGGDWTVGAQAAAADKAGARLVFRFHARDLHLVLGAGADGKPVRFRVTIDGKPPGADHGSDVDAQGVGTVRDQRLYQLVRQQGEVADRRFEIEFLDPGAEAFAFTFG